MEILYILLVLLIAARLFTLSPRESLSIGFAMNARGAVELVGADVALRVGLFSHHDPIPPKVGNLFSALASMAVVTTLMTPAVLRVMSRKE